MLRRSFVGAMLALVLCLGSAGPASADPVKGGNLTLELTPSFARSLVDADVRVEALQPGRVRGRFISLPVEEGLMEAKYGSGYLFLKGGFRLRAEGGTVAVRKLVANFSERELRATVGGRKMLLASLSPQEAEREGLDVNLSLAGAKLTPRAATAIDRGLGLPGALGAKRFASATATARFETLSFNAGTITIALDPAFQAKLQSVGVSVFGSEGAVVSSSSPTSIALPIWRGAIASDLATGIVLSQAGFRLVQAGGAPEAQTQIAFSGVGIALDSQLLSASGSVVSNPPRGPLGTAPLASVRFDRAVVLFDEQSGELVAPERVATLSPQASGPLNDVFATPRGKPGLFSAGEPIGKVGFSVSGTGP